MKTSLALLFALSSFSAFAGETKVSCVGHGISNTDPAAAAEQSESIIEELIAANQKAGFSELVSVTTNSSKTTGAAVIFCAISKRPN